MSRPPSPGVRPGRYPPHLRLGRPTCPLFWTTALGAAQPCGVSLTTGGIAPASLGYHRLTPMARVSRPRCFAGDPLLDCVLARLSAVASMAPGDVCHGPRCSLAGLGPAVLGYRPCWWPGGWVAPVRLTLGVWSIVARPSATLRAHVCAPSTAPWRLVTRLRAWCVLCVPCAVSWASWLLFTSVPAWRVVLCVR